MSQPSPDVRAIKVPPPPKIVTHSALEFMRMDLPERKYLLEPWLPEQGLAMVHASRGIGKTFFGLSVACWYWW
jgi:hypothetical protein